MKTIYLVWGYDDGGNTGSIVEAVFEKREEAEKWAQDPENCRSNHAFSVSQRGTPFEVEERDLYEAGEAP